MGNTPKWERGSHLEISTDEKLDYLYARDDAQQDEIDANKVKVTPATYPEGTETYNIATIKIGNTTKTLKGKEGGGGGLTPVIVNPVYDPETEINTMDKTYNEIRNYMLNGYPVYIHTTYTDGADVFDDYVAISGFGTNEDTTPETGYVLYQINGGEYGTLSADGYPQKPSPEP